MGILLVANVIWLLLNLFAIWALKLSGEGANTIYWGKLFHALIVLGRKECRYASVLALSVWYSTSFFEAHFFLVTCDGRECPWRLFTLLKKKESLLT